MDHSHVAMDYSKDETFQADKMRQMQSFSFGKALSSAVPKAPKHSHARSHSRALSVSAPLSSSTVHNSLSSVAAPDSPPSSPLRTSLSAPKRSSHHRRRSSVSTRHESADLMGVSPNMVASVSEDNINFGDKDSVRRRALWALEGKTEVGDFSKVEIPEFHSPDPAQRTFELPTKPSYPPGIGAGFNGGGLSALLGNKRDSLGSKRDSIGKFITSSSSKEQLGTLVEEEEEEEEEEDQLVIEEIPRTTSPIQSFGEAEPEVASPVEVTVTSPSPAPVRHRPTSLNLRPLSLVAGTVVQNGDLPTPSSGASDRSGLRSLTLGSAPTINRRQSLNLPRSTVASAGLVQRRPSLNVAMDYEVPLSAPARRSSISYFSSMENYGLPTPDMTPVSTRHDRPPSTSSSDSRASSSQRPLSESEQHFLFQAHVALVQRISELERVLSARPVAPRSRPLSCASDASAASGQTEISDEMLQLIADLKAERDELKKDVDGWRTRVSDMNKQMTVFAKRVEVERRDAWVARERVGVLEVEKSGLEQALGEKEAALKAAQLRYEQAEAAAEKAKQEAEKMKSEVERLHHVDDECAHLRAALDQERRKREDMEHELEGAGLLATPRPFDAAVSPMPAVMSRTMMIAKSRGLGFRSIDSESSFTDVESLGSPGFNKNFGLKVVHEEDEDSREESFSDGYEDELSRYEDEEEGDHYAFPTSITTSSFGSVEEDVPVTPHAGAAELATPALTPSCESSGEAPSPLTSPVEPTHVRRASLLKTWTFSGATEAVPIPRNEKDEIDHFFSCLEDMDNSPPVGSQLHSVESFKNMFSQALMSDDEDLPPFVLPSHVGVEVSPSQSRLGSPISTLPAVLEEEETKEEEKLQEQVNFEDEFHGEVYEGGIKFTFDIPSILETPEKPAQNAASPSVESPLMGLFDDEEADSSFTFPQSRVSSSKSTPSSIPRLSSARLSSAVPPSPTPVRSTVSPKDSPSLFTTPPTKRGGATPTFIPQPRCLSSSPASPLKSPMLANKAPSFIPQPRRGPSPTARISAIPVMSPTMNEQNAPSRSRNVHPSAGPAVIVSTAASSDPFLTSPPQPELALSSPSLMSPTLAARIQTFTNYFPMPSLPWSPRAKTASAAAAAFCIIPESASSSSSVVSEDAAHGHNRETSAFVNSTASRPTEVKTTQSRVYVPKERQLEKLRVRLEEERRMKMQGGPNQRSEGSDVLHV